MGVDNESQLDGVPARVDFHLADPANLQDPEQLEVEKQRERSFVVACYPRRVKALVAGATGYTGEHVVFELRTRGIEVIAHVRLESPRRAQLTALFEGAGAAVAHTAWESAALAELLERERPDVIFALLGTTRARAAREGISGDIYDAVEGRLTRLLLDAAELQCKAARFVFLSSIGTQPDTENAYLKTRAALEQRLLQSPLATTAVRAPFISGPDRREKRTAERVGAMVTSGLLAVASRLGARSLRDRYAAMSGAELARGVVLAALEPASKHSVIEPEQLRALMAESS
jgi:nucleoside-diphosphate-sugar epimerase